MPLWLLCDDIIHIVALVVRQSLSAREEEKNVTKDQLSCSTTFYQTCSVCLSLCTVYVSGGALCGSVLDDLNRQNSIPTVYVNILVSF